MQSTRRGRVGSQLPGSRPAASFPPPRAAPVRSSPSEVAVGLATGEIAGAVAGCGGREEASSSVWTTAVGASLAARATESSLPGQWMRGRGSFARARNRTGGGGWGERATAQTLTPTCAVRPKKES